MPGKGGIGPAGRRQLRRAKKGSMLAAVRKDVKNLKKMVNKTIENKQQTYNSATNYVMDIGLAQRPTLLLTQGAADGDARPSAARIGNSVTLMRTKLNLQLRQSTSGLTNTRVRLVVCESVDGKQDIDWEDILQVGAGGTLVGTNDLAYTSCYTTKTQTNKRYKIHYDKVINLSHYAKSFFQKNLVLRYGKTGKVINYDGNNSTPTDYSLQILAIGDQTSVGVAPILSYSLRSTYKDA
jgi:hypothetical protein